MEDIFRDYSEKILLYLGIESINDPYSQEVDIEYLNPIPIRAIVSDISFAKSQWSMPGVTAAKVKQILIEKKHESLFKLSQKLKIDSDEYEGWRENGKLQYKVEGDFLRAFVYIKKYD